MLIFEMNCKRERFTRGFRVDSLLLKKIKIARKRNKYVSIFMRRKFEKFRVD